MKRKTRSLRTVFFGYFLAIVLTFLGVAGLLFGLFDLGLRNGFFTAANAAELAVQNAKAQIADTPAFDASLIPTSATYAFLARNGPVLQSNMEPKERERAIAFAEGCFRPSGADCYVAIERSDGVCIVHYTIHPGYSIPWMRRYLPNGDALIVLLLLGGCLAGCMAVTWRFARRMKAQLRPMMDAVQKISAQDLDFDVQPANVREFNQVLSALSDMKRALAQSLTQQWRMEQTRREQTSALAHDIKTPLTIIRGNAELLSGTEQTEQQAACTDYILKNAGRMDAYLRTLIDLTRADTGREVRLQSVRTADFMGTLSEQTNGLAASRQLAVSIETAALPETFPADPALLERAVMNIVSNAVEFSPEQGRLSVRVTAVGSRLHFCVTDSGRGFSAEELEHAAEQFYMGDRSRSAAAHYGIGLSMAQSVAGLHGGTLRLANSPDTGGAMVTLEIPLDCAD